MTPHIIQVTFRNGHKGYINATYIIRFQSTSFAADDDEPAISYTRIVFRQGESYDDMLVKEKPEILMAIINKIIIQDIPLDRVKK